MRFSFEKISKEFPVPVETSAGTFPRRESLLVRLENEHGDAAYGECAPWLGFGLETLADAENFLRSLDGRVPEKIPAALPCLAHAFSAARFFLENPAAAHALPEALPPPSARAKLLPRRRDDSPGKLLADAARERERGFSVFKIKIGLAREREELRFCEKILADAPAGTRFRFDANGALSADSLPALAELSRAPALEFFEQPLPPNPKNDAQIFAEAERRNSRFALDESVRENPSAFPRETHVVAVVKPLFVADFPALLAWLENPRGADVVISTAFENSLAGTLALRLACARLAPARRRAFGLGK